MRFVGQNFIMRQFQFMLPRLFADQSLGENFLLSGPSGFGKTTMALGICHYLAGNQFETYLYDSRPFLFRKRVIFIDEVHKMKNLEILYPEMDRKEHILVFATNHDVTLEEAFVNRCFHYIFTDYSDDELMVICRDTCSIPIPESGLASLIEAGNRNPRIIKSLLGRMEIYIKANNLDVRTADYTGILSAIFGINDGMDVLARRYLEVLEDLGGNASISLLKSALHVDEGTLRNTIEPVLLAKKKIRISQKGRMLIA